MGILQDAVDEQDGKTRPGAKCLMCQLVSGEDSRLEPSDRPELDQVLRNPGIYAQTVIDVLAARSLTVTHAQVGNHRRKHL